MYKFDLYSSDHLIGSKVETETGRVLSNVETFGLISGHKQPIH